MTLWKPTRTVLRADINKVSSEIWNLAFAGKTNLFEPDGLFRFTG